ncbi:unnamed protein product [Schistosoma curassoni]|uniref:Uncharacterized protein n=1 Tax=Schistosoma curassoni TaxID=6186 RepID=A0A183JT60_9TREM|nr:unnamed protein product [Schistosoma curassoni]
MGNQLTGLSPSPVVEDYLSELSGLVVFEEELCGSRLFKVAKIRLVFIRLRLFEVILVIFCKGLFLIYKCYCNLG